MSVRLGSREIQTLFSKPPLPIQAKKQEIVRSQNFRDAQFLGRIPSGFQGQQP